MLPAGLGAAGMILVGGQRKNLLVYVGVCHFLGKGSDTPVLGPWFIRLETDIAAQFLRAPACGWQMFQRVSPGAWTEML